MKVTEVTKDSPLFSRSITTVQQGLRLFAQLPKVFDRNFVIGYFLPFAIFLAAITMFFEAAELDILPESVFSTNLLAGTTIAGVVAWVGSVFLLLFNQTLIRFLEGYGLLSKLGILKEFQLFKYRRLHRGLGEIEDDMKKRKKNEQKIPGHRATPRLTAKTIRWRLIQWQTMATVRRGGNCQNCQCWRENSPVRGPVCNRGKTPGGQAGAAGWLSRSGR